MLGAEDAPQRHSQHHGASLAHTISPLAHALLPSLTHRQALLANKPSELVIGAACGRQPDARRCPSCTALVSSAGQVFHSLADSPSLLASHADTCRDRSSAVAAITPTDAAASIHSAAAAARARRPPAALSSTMAAAGGPAWDRCQTNDKLDDTLAVKLLTGRHPT
jgi:hypothetical protein